MSRTPAEKTFENKVKKYLDEQGAYFVKYFANAYTKRGIPDVLACVNGAFVGIEVKAQTGKPTEIQLYNVKKIRAAGGYAFVLYPSGFTAFKEIMTGIMHGRQLDDIPEILK